MDISLRKKALRNLAKTDDQKALDAIKKEMARLQDILNSSCIYEEISECLELLDIIGYRCFEQAIEAIELLLVRLEEIELKHKDEEEHPSLDISKYRNEATLMVKSIEVLEHIRYHNPEKILGILFENSAHQNLKISAAAERAIIKFSEYNLDVFYGDGKEWKGLWWQPQEKILEKISSFDEYNKKKFFSSIILACREILSPTVTGGYSDYKTFRFETGAIPATEGMASVRNDAFRELKSLFGVSENLENKKNVINAMHTITETPHTGGCDDDLLELVKEGALLFADFLKEITNTDDMQLLQKIEHDAYWLNHHLGQIDSSIKETALEIRDTLYSIDEFMIFRALIGFDSIFHDWEEGKIPEKSYEEEQKYREHEAKRHAESINVSNYEEWKQRILAYSDINSNDLAMFPYFGKFLEYFGSTAPELAIQFLIEEAEHLKGFAVPLLRGAEKTEKKNEVNDLLITWCNEGKHLFYLARFFEFSKDFDEEIFKSIFQKAVEINDLDALNQIIVSLTAKYDENKKNLLEEIFLPAIEILTGENNRNWIYNFWFRKERRDLLGDINRDGYEILLNSLIHVEIIDYQVESILLPIAESSPELVIQFFIDRLSCEKKINDLTEYEAIPYKIPELSKPLSNSPQLIISTIKEKYDRDQSLFIYQGAKLIKNIFPTLEGDSQDLLIDIANSRDENDILFVLSILRNYDGNSVIHPVCKEVVKILADNERLRKEMLIILSNTGVVSGEYGFVKAYEEKIADIQPWLEDKSSEVKAFAGEYIEYLTNMIETETKRADEQKALMKNEYGNND